MDQTTIAILKNTLAGIPYQQALLFGSQARGTATADSDYDILIIVDDSVTYTEKLVIIDTLQQRIAPHLIPVDIIVKTNEEVIRQRRICGTIVRNALSEAIPL